jgi:hypothetical protein
MMPLQDSKMSCEQGGRPLGCVQVSLDTGRQGWVEQQRREVR